MLPSPWLSPGESTQCRAPGSPAMSVEWSLWKCLLSMLHILLDFFCTGTSCSFGDLIFGNSQKSFGCMIGKQGKLSCYRIAASEVWEMILGVNQRQGFSPWNMEILSITFCGVGGGAVFRCCYSLPMNPSDSNKLMIIRSFLCGLWRESHVSREQRAA